jgi:hypothetical protein
VYATSAKPPLQQGATLTTPVTSGFQHKGEGVEKKTEEQVDKELAGYDYWGIKRKNLVKADGTPWVWNSFTVSLADLPVLMACLPLVLAWTGKVLISSFHQYALQELLPPYVT